MGHSERCAALIHSFKRVSRDFPVEAHLEARQMSYPHPARVSGAGLPACLASVDRARSQREASARENRGPSSAPPCTMRTTSEPTLASVRRTSLAPGSKVARAST